ncbi:MAG: polymer-forming cytoskeletal protein [Pseudobdellovibrio sp.]
MQKEQVISTLIEEGSSFEGRLSYSGTAKISGHFKGEIFTRDHLIISETATVSAEVEASHVILKGQFEGNIVAHGKVIMIPPANFRGTVTTPSLKIEEGVVFEGASYVPKA